MPQSILEDEDVNKFNLGLIALIGNIGSFLYGYEVGGIAWLILSIERYANEADDDNNNLKYYRVVANNAYLLGFIAAAAALGAVVSYGFLLVYFNRSSKRHEIVLAATFYFIGATLTWISGFLDWRYSTPLIILIFGRFFYGTGIAGTLHSVPQYISEVMPAKVRGQFGSSTEAMVMTGILIGFVIGYGIGFHGWVVTFLVASALALVMGLAVVFIPESPTWMIHNQFEATDILLSLKYVYPNANEEKVELLRKKLNDLQAEISKTLEEKMKATNDKQGSVELLMTCLYLENLLTPELKVLLRDRTLNRCLIVKLSFQFFKIFCGQVVILYYASAIFRAIDSNKYIINIIVYVAVRDAIAIIMLWTSDLFGRRDYMLWASIVMFLGLALSSICQALDYPVAALVGLYFSGIGFEIGFGSMAYYLLNEIVPFYVRSTANVLANELLFSCFFVFTFIFPILIDVLGLYILFAIFAGISLYAVYFIYFYLPETRGIHLEEAYKGVDEQFDSAPNLLCCVDGCDDSNEEKTRLL